MGGGWGDANVHVNSYVTYVGFGGGVMLTIMRTTTLHTLGVGAGVEVMITFM